MKHRFAPLVISLVVAAVLVLVLEDFLHQVIVEPILYVTWFATLVLESISQVVFWAVFILVALVVASKSLARGKSASNEVRTPTPSRQGPVADWFALLQRSRSHTFSQWRLAKALRRLTHDILFPDAGSPFYERDEGGERSAAVLPADIHAYFEAPLALAQRSSRFWFLRARGRPTALDLDPEAIVKYLESIIDPLAGD